MSWVLAALLVAAVLILVGAEWPRLNGRVTGSRKERERARRRKNLRVVDDDFARSVQRDLERLPTIEERDVR